ncbi:MAG: S8 family serine peptidase, partial [Lutimonas sp.]
MRINHFIAGLGLTIFLAGCSSTKVITNNNLSKIPVPAGDEVVINLPEKKGTMSEDEIHAWPHADLATDTIPGMSLAKAYDFVADKKANTVIVGIIDSGIDINHEDLKDQIWVNAKDIPNNNKDDDKNGYVDDVHGWNFLGGAKGADTPEQLEVTRLYKRYSEKFDGVDPTSVAAKDKEAYDYFLKIKNDFEKRIAEANENYQYYTGLMSMINEADAAAKAKFGDSYTIENLNTLPADEQNPLLMKVVSSGAKVEDVKKQINGGLDYYGAQVNNQYNLEFDGRSVT